MIHPPTQIKYFDCPDSLWWQGIKWCSGPRHQPKRWRMYGHITHVTSWFKREPLFGIRLLQVWAHGGRYWKLVMIIVGVYILTSCYTYHSGYVAARSSTTLSCCVGVVGFLVKIVWSSWNSINSSRIDLFHRRWLLSVLFGVHTWNYELDIPEVAP